jgi:hypothetical protein
MWLRRLKDTGSDQRGMAGPTAECPGDDGYAARGTLLARLGRGRDSRPVHDLLASAGDDTNLKLRLSFLVYELACRDFPAARRAYCESVEASWRFRAARDIAELGLRCSLLDASQDVIPALQRAMAEEPTHLTIVTGPAASRCVSSMTGKPSTTGEWFGERELHAWPGKGLPTLVALFLHVLGVMAPKGGDRPQIVVLPPGGSSLHALLNPHLVIDPLARLRVAEKVAVYHLGATSLDHLLGSFQLAGAVELETAIHRYFLVQGDPLLTAEDRRRLVACRDEHERGREAIAAAVALFTRPMHAGWTARYVAPVTDVIWQAAAMADIARADYSGAAAALKIGGTERDVQASRAVCLALAGRKPEAMDALREARIADEDVLAVTEGMIRRCF